MEPELQRIGFFPIGTNFSENSPKMIAAVRFRNSISLASCAEILPGLGGNARFPEDLHLGVRNADVASEPFLSVENQFPLFGTEHDLLAQQTLFLLMLRRQAEIVTRSTYAYMHILRNLKLEVLPPRCLR